MSKRVKVRYIGSDKDDSKQISKAIKALDGLHLDNYNLDMNGVTYSVLPLLVYMLEGVYSDDLGATFRGVYIDGLFEENKSTDIDWLNIHDVANILSEIDYKISEDMFSENIKKDIALTRKWLGRAGMTYDLSVLISDVLLLNLALTKEKGVHLVRVCIANLLVKLGNIVNRSANTDISELVPYYMLKMYIKEKRGANLEIGVVLDDILFADNSKGIDSDLIDYLDINVESNYLKIEKDSYDMLNVEKVLMSNRVNLSDTLILKLIGIINDELTNEKTKINDVVDIAKKSERETLKKVKELEKEIKGKDLELKGLKSKYKKLEGESNVNVLNGKIKSLEGQIKGLNNKIVSRENRIATLEDRLKEVAKNRC